MRVGFVFNVITEQALNEAPELALNLTDAPGTIDAVRYALEDGGHTVTPLNADRTLPARLVEAPFDIVFNIATGFYGDSRQANVPAMLEYLRIPHTGAGVLAETITHHKPVMKHLLLGHHVPTPVFQVFPNADEPLYPTLTFPLIVKLPAEGGSLGMTPNSVVRTPAELRAQVTQLLADYRQGALVEDYIDGREFTVTVLGNDPPYCLPVVERLYCGDIHIQLDEPEPAAAEMYEQLTGRKPAYIPVDTMSVAPAQLTPQEQAQIEAVALAAYRVLACQDWARIDLRMDAQGRVYVLDVNLEPAIAPDYAVAKAARAAGWSYTELINRILNHAVARYPWLQKQPSKDQPFALIPA